MKRTIALVALTCSLLAALPAQAQTSALPEAMSQAKQQLERLELSEDQAQGFMQLFLRQLPRLLDAQADPLALARQVAPEAERLLNRDQVDMLRKFEQQQGALDFGTMTGPERRRLVQDGLKRLSHPDTAQWLKRIDSMDF